MLKLKLFGIMALAVLVAACQAAPPPAQVVIVHTELNCPQDPSCPPAQTAGAAKMAPAAKPVASRATTKVIGIAPSIDARMPATSAAPIPVELNKPVICDDPRCAPVKAVYVHGVAKPVFVQPTTTEVVKVEKIDCARTPGCVRTTNLKTGMSTGKVDNGEFDPHEYLRNKKP